MLRSVAIVAAGVLAGTLGTAPAPAATPDPLSSAPSDPLSTAVLVDTTADVWRIGPGEDTWHFFGVRPTVDFDQAVVTHRDRSVTVSMHFVDLRKVKPQAFVVKFRTPKGFRRAEVQTSPGLWSGLQLFVDKNYEDVPCPRLTHHVSYAKDRVDLRVPRPCLGKPAWVKAKISGFLFRQGDELSDNPHNPQAEPTFTRRIPHPAG